MHNAQCTMHNAQCAYAYTCLFVVAHPKRELGTVLDVEIFQRVPMIEALFPHKDHVIDNACICRPPSLETIMMESL